MLCPMTSTDTGTPGQTPHRNPPAAGRRRGPVALAAALLTLAPALAQSTDPSPLADRPNGPRVAEPPLRAIVNATIHPAPDADPFVGTIVFEGGRIGAVLAEGHPVPQGAMVYDATGLHAYAGFVEPFLEVEAPAPDDASAPGAHWNSMVTPRRRALDGAWPDGGTRSALHALGYTVAGISPEGGIFRGWNAVVSLADPVADASQPRPTVLADGVAQVVAFESSGWGSREYPTSQVGSVALVRQTLSDAGWQAANPPAAGNALTPLENPAVALWFDTPAELEAVRAAKIARQFGRRAVIVGSGQEYQRLDALLQESARARDGLRLVVPLRFPEAPRVTSVAEAQQIDLGTLMAWEQAPTNPRRLIEAGLDVALTSSKIPQGIGGRKAFGKLLNRAIEHGLTERDALAALTTAPADLLGVGDRVGTIQAGKLANVVLASKPIFEKGAAIRDVWIEGRRHEVTPREARPLEGVWRVTLDGRFRLDITVDAKGKATVTDPALAGEDAPSAEARVERGAAGVTFVFDHEPFGSPGVFTLTGIPTGDTIAGVGARADGRTFPFKAERAPADADPTENDPADEDQAEGQGRGTSRDGPDDSAGDAPPEDLGGYPFGPYAVADLPAQRDVLIHNATVWTVSDRGTIANGWVLLRGGKVHDLGSGRPPGVVADVVIDAQGRHVTPGLIDAHSHTGTWTGGTNEAGQAVTAEVRMADTTDPNPVNWYRQLAGGVTTVNTLHGSANPIGGQNVIQKVRWGSVHPDDMHLKGARPGIKFALGENVKQSNWGDRFTTRYPQTRMGVETLIRDRFTAAREYAARGMRTENGRVDYELEALAEILAGDRLIHCHSYRQDEILMLCRVAEDFGFKIGTFQHGLECYKVAEAVKEHAIGASLFSDWWAYKVEVQDAIPYAGPMLHKAGVNVSFNSDSDELARRMNVEAAKAVKYGGLTPEQAIRFVTINPAIQLGIQDRVGSIEPGKDADVVVWSGDPLSTMTRCERVFIDGREYFSLQQDKAHRERIAAERRRLIQKLMREQAKLPERSAPTDAPDAPGERADDPGVDGPTRRGVYAWFYGDGRHQPAGASMCGACGVVPADLLRQFETSTEESR